MLVCDDERQILRALRVLLKEADFEVTTAETAQEALDAVTMRPPDAAILDLILPDGNGVDICRSIREWSEMPIIVLSAVGDESEKVRALEAGADDYVTKPFGPDELIARLRAALRRTGAAPAEPVLRADGLELDQAAHRVTVGGEEVHLTPIEFDLLRALMRNRGRLMTHRMLLREVWGPAYEDDTQVLRVHVANLRRKIEPRAGLAAAHPHRSRHRVPPRGLNRADLYEILMGVGRFLHGHLTGRGQSLWHGRRFNRHRRRLLRDPARLPRGARAGMSGAELLGLLVSIAVAAYLVYALLRGERL